MDDKILKIIEKYYRLRAFVRENYDKKEFRFNARRYR